MKARGYARKQCEVLRELEDLKASAQPMYLLDNAKDQIMSLLTVALTNLVMWVRDRFFPSSCAQSTWKRLRPFFQLPGLIRWSADQCEVVLRRFNDKALNRELSILCERVNDYGPQLPDGRTLIMLVGES